MQLHGRKNASEHSQFQGSSHSRVVETHHKAPDCAFKNSCSRNKLDWNETKCLSEASWTFCPSCGRRKADGKLEEGWLNKKDISRVAIPCKGGCDPRADLLCRPKGDAAVAPSRLPYVAPQQDAWPEELLGLTEVEAESLQIIRPDATFRTVQGGKSPVASRKKTQVIKARWQRTDIQAGLPTAAARAAFAWLMEHNNTTYQEYIKNHKRLLAERHVDGDRWWMVSTAELPMQTPGVEVAARTNSLLLGILWRYRHQDSLGADGASPACAKVSLGSC